MRNKSAGHISSAIVSARECDAAFIAAQIAAMQGNEIHAVAGTRIIVVMEDRDARGLSDRFTAISALPGVLAASMVFEQALEQ